MNLSYEFGPDGPRLLQDAGPMGGIVNARDAIAQTKASATAETPVALLPEQVRALPVTPQAGIKKGAPLNRRSFVAELKAHLSEIRRELKAKHLLESEEHELVRLIAAAKQPPARVTPINSARKSG